MRDELFSGFSESGWDQAPWDAEPLSAAEAADCVGCAEHDVLRLRRTA